MNSKGVEEVPEDVIHVIINPATWQTKELCLYILMSRLFMIRFYCAVFFHKIRVSIWKEKVLRKLQEFWENQILPTEEENGSEVIESAF